MVGTSNIQVLFYCQIHRGVDTIHTQDKSIEELKSNFAISLFFFSEIYIKYIEKFFFNILQKKWTFSEKGDSLSSQQLQRPLPAPAYLHLHTLSPFISAVCIETHLTCHFMFMLLSHISVFAREMIKNNIFFTTCLLQAVLGVGGLGFPKTALPSFHTCLCLLVFCFACCGAISFCFVFPCCCTLLVYMCGSWYFVLSLFVLLLCCVTFLPPGGSRGGAVWLISATPQFLLWDTFKALQCVLHHTGHNCSPWTKFSFHILSIAFIVGAITYIGPTPGPWTNR